MYPGGSIWARGVLALGAGTLLLSSAGPRWRDGDESPIRTDGEEARSPARATGAFWWRPENRHGAIARAASPSDVDARRRSGAKEQLAATPSPSSRDDDDLAVENIAARGTRWGSRIGSRDAPNSQSNDDREITSSPITVAESRRERGANEDGFYGDGGGAYRLLDPDVPPGSKRRKVTLAEDPRELMAASNFARSVRDDRRGIDASDVVRYEADSSDPTRERRRRRRDARSRGAGGRRTDSPSSAEPAIGDDRRARRANNHHSVRSPTPMAYVHIQPAYPPAMMPPPGVGRKCVRCMVVYKPCTSQSRTPSGGSAPPTYRYRESATKWRGLKYGE